MNAAILTAMISTSGAVLIGITALVLNYRGFVSIERRLEILEGDLKEFYKHLGQHETEIARLKDKTGLQ